MDSCEKADTWAALKPQGQGGQNCSLGRTGFQGSLGTAQTGWASRGQEVRVKAQQREGEELQIRA